MADHEILLNLAEAVANPAAGSRVLAGETFHWTDNEGCPRGMRALSIEA